MSFRGNRSRGRPVGNFRRQLFKDYEGPPQTVTLLGQFSHTCEADLVVKSKIKDVPYFNAPVYVENKQQIGKVDEIFGQTTDYYVSVRLSEDISAKSFMTNQNLFIDPSKLLPLQRFLQNDFKPRGFKNGRGIGKFNNNRRGGSVTVRGGARGTRNTRFRRGGRGGYFNGTRRGNYARSY